MSDPTPEVVTGAALESEAAADESSKDPVTHSVSPYSTAPAPQRPFVVRVQLAIVDDTGRLVSKAEGSHLVSPADFAHDETEDVEAEAARFSAPGHAFESRGIASQAEPLEPEWIDPTVPVQSHGQTDWLDAAPQSQSQSEPHPVPEPTPWIPTSAPVERFAESTAVPPSAAANAPAAAPDEALQPLPQPVAGLAPVESDSSPFAAPPPAPLAMQGAGPFEEAAPPGLQPAYTAEPLALLPAVPDQAASPFAPSPFAPGNAAPASAPAVPTTTADAGVAAQSAPVTAQDHSDLWFLSTEPGGVDADGRDDIAEGNEPSAILTGILTIGMAVLVIVLVLVFIQALTSILR